MVSSSLLFACALGLGRAVRVDPAFAEKLELYHVNEANYTGIEDMNTADAAGDSFFDMLGIIERVSCRNSTHHYPGECSNPEVVAPNLVITKVKVETDSRFGQYGRCNVCLNGTEHHGGGTCESGKYYCNCAKDFDSWVDCDGKVGREQINVTFDWTPRPGDSETSFYISNLVRRVGGFWYSTTHQALQNNTWVLTKTIRRVNATCHANKLENKVRDLKPDCFEQCPQPNNSSSTCYVNCVFRGILGPEAGTTVPSKGGLEGPAIVKLWTDSFDECPAV